MHKSWSLHSYTEKMGQDGEYQQHPGYFLPALSPMTGTHFIPQDMRLAVFSYLLLMFVCFPT